MQHGVPNERAPAPQHVRAALVKKTAHQGAPTLLYHAATKLGSCGRIGTAELAGPLQHARWN